jgi:hypothetical protein
MTRLAGCVFRLMPGHSSGPRRAAIPAHGSPCHVRAGYRWGFNESGPGKSEQCWNQLFQFRGVEALPNNIFSSCHGFRCRDMRKEIPRNSRA